MRIRSCHPAESGGTPCPEKNKENLRLYEEKMDCSRCDCESMKVVEDAYRDDGDDVQHGDEK